MTELKSNFVKGTRGKYSSIESPEITEGQTCALLDCYRVLDLTDEKGQFCGKILADIGAEVIQIEKPGGNPSRNLGPFYHDIEEPEKSLQWFAYNTSKKSITLDIESKRGREIFKNLVKTADFLIESFDPGYMDSLSLGYSQLSLLNPGLIYTTITPFGQTGPYSNYKGSDIITMAMGGLMDLCGYPDRAPLRVSIDQTYPMAGVQAAAGAMIAFYHRLMTGEGQLVDVSLQHSMVQTLMQPMPAWALNQFIQKREGVRNPRDRVAVRLVFPCKDGFIAWRIFPGLNGNRTRALVEWMMEEGDAGELESIIWEETSYRSFTQEQVDRWEEIFINFFMKYTKNELQEQAIKRGIFIFPVSQVNDLAYDPQLEYRRYWVEVEHPELKENLTYPGAPFIMSETPWHISRRPPLIGEHNVEIYSKELAITESEMQELKTRNII